MPAPNEKIRAPVPDRAQIQDLTMRITKGLHDDLMVRIFTCRAPHRFRSSSAFTQPSSNATASPTPSPL